VNGRHPVTAPNMTTTDHLNLVAGVGTGSGIACMVSRRTNKLTDSRRRPRWSGKETLEFHKTGDRKSGAAVRCSAVVRRHGL
jgi:hypothetical protein